MLLEWLRQRQTIVIPLVLFLLSLGLLSFGSYSRRETQMSRFSKAILTVLGFGQQTVTGTSNSVSKTFHRYFWLVGVEEENGKLKAEISELRRQKYLLTEQAIENDRLRRLLNFRPAEAIQGWLPAQVSAWSPVGYNQTLTIRRGSLDGIRPQMSVITYDSALVGQILDEQGSEISYNSSQVLKIIDRRSRVAVMVQRPESRAHGMLAGDPESQLCELQEVDRLADVKVGDLLITSGEGRVFMKGWPVGRVTEIYQDPYSYNPRIRVAPIADFARLEEVIVIIPWMANP